MPLVIAHRGASAYEHENSIAAFRTAMAMGADGVELDVHVTDDGVPMVHHDPAVGSHRIADATFAMLDGQMLPNGEPLPTLRQALDALGAEQLVFVELKALPEHYDENLLDILAAGPAPERYHVHAFDHRIVRRLRTRRPELRCGLLSCSYPVRPFMSLLDAGASTLWQRQELVDAALLEEARTLGLRVFAWTTDDPTRMRELVDLGVDGLCTNRPDVGRDVVGSRAAST
jgi:glycerophosphoryl diester phosphodiesterase